MGSDDGFVIPVRSKIGHELSRHFERLVSWYERKQFIPVYIEDTICNFYLSQRCEVQRNQHREQFSAAGKRVWQSSALVSPTKTLNTDLAPIGDGIEPTDAPREEVEMENEEDGEPLEAEAPGARMSPKNPTSRETQEREDSGHAVYRSWCADCVEFRGVGWQHRIALLDEEERERTTPIVAVDYVFMTQEKSRHVSNADLSRKQIKSNWCDMLRTEKSHVGFINDLGFRRII